MTPEILKEVFDDALAKVEEEFSSAWHKSAIEAVKFLNESTTFGKHLLSAFLKRGIQNTKS